MLSMQTVIIGAAAAAADPLELLTGMVVAGTAILGLTLLYTFIIALDPGKKKQLPAAVLLFIVMLLCFTLPLSLAGIMPEPAYLLVPLSLLSLVPLSVILPGVLWFWPRKGKDILIAAFLCAGMTYVLDVLLSNASAAIPWPAWTVSALNGLLETSINLPAGFALVYLAAFFLSTLVAVLVYRLLGIFGSRRKYRELFLGKSEPDE